VTLSAETGEVLKDDEEATQLVRNMIESGLLNGELQLGSSGDDSYLLFHEDSESMTEAAFAQEIAQRHHNIESLGKQYKTTNERLGSSREYVRHVAREQKRADKDADPGVGFDSQIEDEDLMTGIMAHG
jgi:COP9 signalosome complex subunit 3